MSFSQPFMNRIISNARNGLNNELLRTGLVLLVAGKALAEASKLIGFFWDRLKGKFVVTVELNSKDESYRWIVDFLTSKECAENSNNFAVETSYDSNNGNDFWNRRPSILFSPAVGSSTKIIFKSVFLIFTSFTRISSLEIPKQIALDSSK